MSIDNFNVLAFGADPCGKRDSWQAFKDWSAAISNAGGGIGIVPPGTYKIDKVIINAGGSDSKDHIRFEGCKGLHLIGYGATLDLAPFDDDKEHKISLKPQGNDTHMLCPFFIYNCNNVCVEGFEVNGHKDLVQYNGVIEPGAHCVYITNSNHVTIRHMHIHHGWTDAINVRAADSAYPTRLACRNVVIENCELHSNDRAGIAIHETRHVRISDCRIYDNGMGIDIEPDLWIGATSPLGTISFDKDINPPGSSRFTLIENCEIYNNEKPLSVVSKYSQVRVQGCFIDNQRNSQQPVILSVPHCALLDCEIDTGTGRIDVALTGSTPGNNVFTMERCLIRATSGDGLHVLAEVGRISQALIANCRFICEATSPTSSNFPYLGTQQDMLMLTFRDNYTFIPSESYSGSRFKICSTVAASLVENNAWETDYIGDEEKYLGVYYHTDSSVYPNYPILVRNERFITRYDLLLTSVATFDGLLNEGRYLVIVAFVGTDLHFRIFDIDGNKVAEKAENEVVKDIKKDLKKSIKDLKEREAALKAWKKNLEDWKTALSTINNPSDLSKEQKQQIIIVATAYIKHALLYAPYLGIRAFDGNPKNSFPFSGGISAIGDEINLGKQRILYGGSTAPTSGSFNQGDLIFKNTFNNILGVGESMGWICVKGGKAGTAGEGAAEFRAMPLI
jgi:Right handed beta helix region